MTKQFAVTGMTCAACSAHVERAVAPVAGSPVSGGEPNAGTAERQL